MPVSFCMGSVREASWTAGLPPLTAACMVAGNGPFCPVSDDYVASRVGGMFCALEDDVSDSEDRRMVLPGVRMKQVWWCKEGWVCAGCSRVDISMPYEWHG